MNGGVLNNIFRKLTNRYGEDAMNIMFQYGDDIAEKGSDSFLGKLSSRKIKEPDPMIIGHSISSPSLKYNFENYDGKLINPSIQTTKLEENMPSLMSYGDIFLLGTKDMARKTQSPVDIYARDSWTGRHPQIEQAADGGSVIAGTDIKPTVDTLSGAMSGIGDSFRDEGALSGSISALMSKYTPRYDHMTDILQNQNKLASNFEVSAMYGGNQDALEEILKKRSGSEYAWQLPGHGTPEMRESMASLISDLDKYKQGVKLDTDDADQIAAFYDRLVNTPHFYNEIKYNKPLDISRFSGAYVPVYSGSSRNTYRIDPKIQEYLTNAGVEIRPYLNGMYNGDDLVDYIPDRDIINSYDALSKQVYADTKKDNRWRTPYLLGTAGAVPTAGILSSLLGGQNTEQEYV